jgi:hypothetical protein
MARSPSYRRHNRLVEGPFPETKFDQRRKDIKMNYMKSLPKMKISDKLNAQINESVKITDLCKADVVRQALRIGLPQFAARFQPAPLWLEERIREALAETAESLTPAQFRRKMKATIKSNRMGF